MKKSEKAKIYHFITYHSKYFEGFVYWLIHTRSDKEIKMFYELFKSYKNGKQ